MTHVQDNNNYHALINSFKPTVNGRINNINTHYIIYYIIITYYKAEGEY